MQAIVNFLLEETSRVMPQLLKKLEPAYTGETAIRDQLFNDGYAEELNRAIRAMASQSRDISRLAGLVARNWSEDVNATQRKRFYNSLQRALGVNLNGIASEAGINDIIESRVGENVGLIQSLPDEYYKKINTIINDMTSRKNTAGSIIDELQKVGIQTKNRARLIARDQTQKLNAALTQTRQENLGIEEYEWQTSEDERVRDSHKRKNGKVFRWDDPPKDTGHPGEDINCRCVALPIIDLDNVRR